MSYTINDANIELEKIISGERVATLDELNSIFSNLDVTDVNANTNAKTVLYSGMGSSFYESLANNPDEGIFIFFFSIIINLLNGLAIVIFANICIAILYKYLKKNSIENIIKNTEEDTTKEIINSEED